MNGDGYDRSWFLENNYNLVLENYYRRQFGCCVREEERECKYVQPIYDHFEIWMQFTLPHCHWKRQKLYLDLVWLWRRRRNQSLQLYGSKAVTVSQLWAAVSETLKPSAPWRTSRDTSVKHQCHFMSWRNILIWVPDTSGSNLNTFTLHCWLTFPLLPCLGPKR